jgi:hypothetical protein
LLALALVWPLLMWVRSRFPAADRVLPLMLSVFVAHAAWHWLAERFETLSRADWPALVEPLWPHGVSALLLLAALLMALRALRRSPHAVAKADSSP